MLKRKEDGEATSLGLLGGARLQKQLDCGGQSAEDGGMGCEEFCGAACGRSLRGLTEMNGGTRE